MDLAVGMIVGSAFTAVITALVKNILTPLINAIPGANETGALQTVLREAVTDTNGNVVTEALILDWGAVISAVITFFLTALVLFVIVKAFNRLKEAGGKVKEEIKNAVRKEESPSSVVIEEVAAAVAPEKAVPSEAVSTPDYEKLLKEIIELLRASAPDAGSGVTRDKHSDRTL